jgi:SNF2 family DNA or RNA helicase
LPSNRPGGSVQGANRGGPGGGRTLNAPKVKAPRGNMETAPPRQQVVRQASDMALVQAMIHFTFGYVKQQAQPGSWRRGYLYYRENQIQQIVLDELGVTAKVKGKFKDAYSTRILFLQDHVEPHCDCPLEDLWCKHAVAVALEAVSLNYWEIYYGLPTADAPPLRDPNKPPGGYRFGLKADRSGRPKFLGIRVEERGSHKIQHNLEAVLGKVVELATEFGEDSFNWTEKREIAIMQFILKHAKGKPDHGWFLIPLEQAEPLMQLLSQVDALQDPQGQPLYFEPDPLFLLMAVNMSSNAGSVLVSLHWIRQEPYDAYPLEELTSLGPDFPWALYRNRIYPLANTLSELPDYLTKGTFTDIKDADGGRFLYEELPHLRKLVDMDLADVLHQLDLKRKPPIKVLSCELMDEATLKIRASLEFDYDGVKVPFSKKMPETPYVMISKGKKGKERHYWIRRDIQGEQEAYQTLLDGGLEVLQTNHLFAEGDNAIDFYNITLHNKTEQEVDPWRSKFDNDMSALKSSDHPLQLRGQIEFAQTVDQFVLRIDCTIGDREMSLDDVQKHLMQGKKYFFTKGLGYVEVPLANILYFIKTLEFFDAEQPEPDTYIIQTYRAGLIAELLDQGIVLDMSTKFQKFWDVISSQQTMEDVAIPTVVQAELRPYQKAGFNWIWFLYSYGLNGILADDMGLGKTLQTLVAIQHAKDEDGPLPSLIICPTSVVYNWINEIQKFTPGLSVVNLTGSDRHVQYKKIKEADAVITSYALLRRDIRALKEYPFRFAILDESQNIKNFESQTAQASKHLQASHRLALSGTPVENRLIELWSVFDFLMPGFLYDNHDFRYRYVVPIEEKGNRDAERRLKKQVFPFMLRRLKQDVAKDLPPKIEAVSYCQLTEKQRELYLEVLEKTREEVFSNVANSGMPGATNSIFAALLRLRQICCHPQLMGEEMSGGLKESGKFTALTEMLEEVISEGHRILLFSQFVEMLKIVRTWLDKKGYKYEFLTGESTNRHLMVDRFNNDPTIPIFLMSLKAGGTGLNLTGADYVIHYDPWWNPAAEDQASDRAHRIGQKKTVFVYKLITKGTVEEKILKLQDRKRDLVDSIIAADRSVGKMLSFEDLKEILSPDF